MKSEKATTTIWLPKDAHRELKHLAVDRGVTLRDLVWEAVEDFLEKVREQQKRAA